MPGIMKVIIVFVAILFVAAQGAEDYCSKEIDSICRQTRSKQEGTQAIVNCTASYGAIKTILPHLQSYVNEHVTRSFEYLLLSTHYANYEKNREGFEKLFRDLSDSKWNEAIDLIKYIGKRGGEMNFSRRRAVENVNRDNNYEIYELESLAKALDIEKDLAKQAFHIHGEASRKHTDSHDPEISSFIEEHYVHKQAETIRKLSGYAHDLVKILAEDTRQLGLYFFDEYLQSQ